MSDEIITIDDDENDELISTEKEIEIKEEKMDEEKDLESEKKGTIDKNKEEEINTDDGNKKEDDKKDDDENKEEEIECAICLNPCMQPVLLPCSHTFCFLCAKVTTFEKLFPFQSSKFIYFYLVLHT